MKKLTIIICIECSNRRGMGHFYRQMNVSKALGEKGLRCVFLVNNDEKTLALLKKSGIDFETVDLLDYTSDWETALIKKYNAALWINDRMDTDGRHVKNVKANDIPVFTFDDCGGGAKYCDMNFNALSDLNMEYLILNKDIEKFKKNRYNYNKEKIIVTLGGSDTYGVTVQAAKTLQSLGKTATIICGNSFEHFDELYTICGDKFVIKRNVPSLIEELSHYDLAVTGGGMTAFECAASGLPNIIIANELHEIKTGEYLQSIGAAIFAGYYKEMDTSVFERELDICKMSESGMKHINTNGLYNVTNVIMEKLA